MLLGAGTKSSFVFVKHLEKWDPKAGWCLKMTMINFGDDDRDSGPDLHL